MECRDLKSSCKFPWHKLTFLIGTITLNSLFNPRFLPGKCFHWKLVFKKLRHLQPFLNIILMRDAGVPAFQPHMMKKLLKFNIFRATTPFQKQEIIILSSTLVTVITCCKTYHWVALAEGKIRPTVSTNLCQSFIATWLFLPFQKKWLVC